MIFEDPEELAERIDSLAGRKVHGRVQVLEDTSDYMEISSGTVLRLGGQDYYIRGEAKEGRFGIADGAKVLVVLDAPSEVVRRSVRNLEKVKLIAADQLNVFYLLHANHLVVSEEALAKIQEVYGDD